jgi:hypothetical protein
MNIPKIPYFPSKKNLLFEKGIFLIKKNSNISTNIIISVEIAKVLLYMYIYICGGRSNSTKKIPSISLNFYNFNFIKISKTLFNSSILN